MLVSGQYLGLDVLKRSKGLVSIHARVRRNGTVCKAVGGQQRASQMNYDYDDMNDIFEEDDDDGTFENGSARTFNNGGERTVAGSDGNVVKADANEDDPSLELSNYDISKPSLDALAARGITRLFPI